MVVPDSIIMALIFGATCWSEKDDKTEPCIPESDLIMGTFFYWLFEADRGGTYSVIIVVPCGVFLASHLRLACLSGWVECTRSKRWCAAAAGRNEHVRYRSRWVFIYLFAFTYNNILLNTAAN